jgi:LEA14-like dessication related protein
MKKIVIIILVVATVLNSIAASFIFLDIQTMTLPEPILRLELINITSDQAVLQTTLWINNQNSFPIYLQNLTILTTADNGDVINHISLEGGETKAYENRTFTTTVNIRFNGSLPDHLTSRITGTFGTMFLGMIKKTFPLKFSMITSFHDILKQFSLPSIHLAANFSEITQEGITFTGIIDITNPNSIDIAIENISMNIQTEKEIQVGVLTILGKTIPAKTSQQLTGTGQLHLTALDAETLRMTLTGEFIIFAAGIRKPMDLSVDADIIPPSLEMLLSDVPTEASLTGNYRLTFKGGLRDEITFKMKNPNKLTFLATDITVRIYRVDNNKTRLISNGTLPDSVIPPENTTIIQGNMFIPLSELRPRRGERFIPDQLQVRLRANITIEGLNQTIWIGVIGYQDFLFHRLLGSRIFSTRDTFDLRFTS